MAAETNNTKKHIVFLNSHLYLFWTTAVYFLWELANDYELIIIADITYEHDRRFNSICRKLRISKIYYVNLFSKGLVYQRSLRDCLQKVLSDNHVSFIFQHDYYFIQNIYLFYLAKKQNPDIVNIVYMNSQVRATPPASIFAQLDDQRARSLARMYGLPKSLFRLLISVYRFAKRGFNNFVGPLLILGSGIKYFWDKNNASLLMDSYLVYSPQERDLLAKSPLLCDKLSLITSPHKTVGQKCNDYIYGVSKGELVTILPSLIGFAPFNQDFEYLRSWARAINLLSEIFQDYKIILKFHPGTLGNPDSSKIVKYFEQNCQNLTVFPPSTSAEKLILQSKVVVGDVSNTLWWANLIGKRLVISLDIKHELGSQDMKLHPGVLYFESLEDLERNSAGINDNREQTLLFERGTAPSLLRKLSELEL